MTHPPSRDSTSPWKLEKELASCYAGNFQLKVSLSEPFRGASLRWEESGRAPFEANLFQLQWPWKTETEAEPGSEPISEAYVRHQDLVITYQQRAPRTVRPQVYWRSLSSGRTSPPQELGLEFLLSLQTDRLASEPKCQLVTEFLGEHCVLHAPPTGLESTGTVWQPVPPVERVELTSAACRPCLLFRPTGSDWSYLEMLYPGDFTHVAVERRGIVGSTGSRWTLFDEDLEKGVIRRARLRGMLLHRENDHVVAEQLWNEFLQSELPLTT
jgi:hypothetical protein